MASSVGNHDQTNPEEITKACESQTIFQNIATIPEQKISIQD